MNKSSLSVNGKDFPIYVAEPEGDAKGSVIVIHEVWGLAPHIKNICDRLAKEGYIALAPNLLSETKIEEMVDESLIRDLFDPEKRTAIQPKLREIMAPIQAPEFAEETKIKLRECYDYLLNNFPTKDNIAVMGYCFGGTYSFQMAIMESNLKAAIPYYGHAEFSVEELKNIECPVLAFYGENDHNLVDNLPELVDKMKQAGVNFEYKVYSNCGHAFFNDTNPHAYNKEAATDSWQRVLKFLNDNV